jgi:hypothetical protein
MRFASTTVSLQFHNARDCTQLETLKLQKPRHARLSTLTIATTDCVTVGQVEATADAVTQFETAVASGHEGAIVHSYDLDSLMLQVSIAPRAPLNVTLTYEEVLERKAGGVSLVLPLSPGLPAVRAHLPPARHPSTHPGLFSLRVGKWPAVSPPGHLPTFPACPGARLGPADGRGAGRRDLGPRLPGGGGGGAPALRDRRPGRCHRRGGAGAHLRALGHLRHSGGAGGARRGARGARLRGARGVRVHAGAAARRGRAALRACGGGARRGGGGRRRGGRAERRRDLPVLVRGRPACGSNP